MRRESRRHAPGWREKGESCRQIVSAKGAPKLIERLVIGTPW
jgi:hypothetical protein